MAPTPHDRCRRIRTLCSRTGCGKVARWQSRDSNANYCCDHAADIAEFVPLRRIEGAEQKAS